MVHKCSQAVILAAGMGKRLESDIPKCLYSFNGKTLIERNIDLMMKNGVKEVIVIGGYKFEMLEDHLKGYKNVILVNNLEYNKYQTTQSMSLAYPFISDCFIQTEGDLVFEEKALKELLKSSANTMVHSGYKDTHSVSVPQFENGMLVNFTRGIEYRNGVQQPPNFTGPSHFTKEMLGFMKNYNQINNYTLLYEEAVAMSVSKESIPLSMLYIPGLRYWDLNVKEDYDNVKSLINTLDEEDSLTIYPNQLDSQNLQFHHPILPI
jgi:choline kinase